MKEKFWEELIGQYCLIQVAKEFNTVNIGGDKEWQWFDNTPIEEVFIKELSPNGEYVLIANLAQPLTLVDGKPFWSLRWLYKDQIKILDILDERTLEDDITDNTA